MSRASNALAPAARGARRLALLGGSFDPPHRGHLHVLHAARAARALDHVVFVPAARPPHKPGRVLASGAERVAMLELLLADEAETSIWTLELERCGPSYTIDTVRELRVQRPAGAPPYLVIGSDNLPGLPAWREAGELLELVEPLIVPRRGSPVDLDALGSLAPRQRARLAQAVLDVAPVEVSSSEVRAFLEAGELLGESLLPPALREYVAARGLYGGAR